MRKGFTLIEVVVAGALLGILLSMQTGLLSKYMKFYKTDILESREAFNAYEAFAFIEYAVNISEYVRVGNDVIELEREDGKGTDWIAMNGNGNLAIFYDSDSYNINNNIMKNVRSFKTEQRGMVLFVSIITLKGNEYKECIMLKTEKATVL